jgi:hypothetical protein
VEYTTSLFVNLTYLGNEKVKIICPTIIAEDTRIAKKMENRSSGGDTIRIINDVVKIIPRRKNIIVLGRVNFQ